MVYSFKPAKHSTLIGEHDGGSLILNIETKTVIEHIWNEKLKDYENFHL